MDKELGKLKPVLPKGTSLDADAYFRMIDNVAEDRIRQVSEDVRDVLVEDSRIVGQNPNLRRFYRTESMDFWQLGNAGDIEV